MPFAETRMDLEIITLREAGQTEKGNIIHQLHVESEIQYKRTFFYKVEINLQS